MTQKRSLKRRDFIRKAAAATAAFAILPGAVASGLVSSCNRKGNGKVLFAVCSDVHNDIFYGAEERLSEFIDRANEVQADFIIQLGDFCFPIERNRSFLSTWNNFHGPAYHVLGNHDMDTGSKEETMRFLWGQDYKSYYSFDVGDFHFVVIDPNNINVEGKFFPFEKGNYYSYKAGQLNHVTPEQLEWLEKDLAKTDKPTVVFSHQVPNLSVSNKDELMPIIVNSGKVIACFSGHHHGNWHIEEDGINHIQINSMCYNWVGSEYSYEGRFPEEVEKQYRNLKNVIPYKDPLYALIELDPYSRRLIMIGVCSEFVPPGPEELGMDRSDFFSLSPSIDSRLITF